MECLVKHSLDAEVSLYMLKLNEDRLPIGGVCLIWRGYGAGWCALYSMWQWAHKADICQRQKQERMEPLLIPSLDDCY